MSTSYDDIDDFLKRRRQTLSEDEDYSIRTIIGEASTQDAKGWQSVAGVIKNRAQQRGKSFKDVVLEHGQFEPWARNKKGLLAIDPESDQYKRVAEAALPVLRGE